MYTGNGATKNFPIPDGYDGSTVILTMPSGKGIKMTQGDGYEIKNNEVVFTAAVPAGITVSFDESGAAEIMSAKSGGYVVIYSDGTIKEVSEDPVLILEQSQKLLADAKKQSDEITEKASSAISYLTGLGTAIESNLEGRLTGYAQRAESIAAEAAASVKSELRNEYALMLESLSSKSAQMTQALQEIKLVQEALKEVSITTARDTKQEIISQCENVMTAYHELKNLKSEIKTMTETNRADVLQIKQDCISALGAKVNEEIGVIQSLRLKMEEDYKMLNTKINNRWELLRGELDGR